MNKWKRTFVCVIIIMMLNIFPSYAETDTFYWNGVEFQDYDNNSTILPEDVKQSRGMVRGEVISTGLVSIKNQGDRKATLIIQTLAHVRCDRICNTLILQKWNESDGDWEQILSYDFEALQKDNPDEDLLDGHVKVRIMVAPFTPMEYIAATEEFDMETLRKAIVGEAEA